MSGVNKSYGQNKVLCDLDLTVRTGEVFALLGPNGAGKTTAVEILEGYRKADFGRVEVFGIDPAGAGAELRARIGIVLQETTSFERSTSLETVRMFAATFPNPMKAEAALDLVGLTAKSGDTATSMSGGQRRRLDLACGLVGNPDLLFLDEPTVGLDPEARRDLWQVIADMRTEGTTVLLTTHHLEEAEILADRIGVLLGGRLHDVAEPARLGGRHHAEATIRFVPSSEARTALADWQPEADWQPDGEAILQTTADPGAVIADLVGRFGELAELTVSRPSLEDVYLDMVRHTAGQSQPEAEL